MSWFADVPVAPVRRRPTAPSGCAVHDGLLEYEVVDDGRVALTPCARSATSRAGAVAATVARGPTIPVTGAQMLGAALSTRSCSTGDCARPAATEPPTRSRFRSSVPARSARVPNAPAAGTPRADGAEVSVVLRDEDGLSCGVFRERAEPGPVTSNWKAAPRGWIVDLRGTAPRSTARRLGPWEICTLHLRLTSRTGGASSVGAQATQLA